MNSHSRIFEIDDASMPHLATEDVHHTSEEHALEEEHVLEEENEGDKPVEDSHTNNNKEAHVRHDERSEFDKEKEKQEIAW